MKIAKRILSAVLSFCVVFMPLKSKIEFKAFSFDQEATPDDIVRINNQLEFEKLQIDAKYKNLIITQKSRIDSESQNILNEAIKNAENNIKKLNQAKENEKQRISRNFEQEYKQNLERQESDFALFENNYRQELDRISREKKDDPKIKDLSNTRFKCMEELRQAIEKSNLDKELAKQIIEGSINEAQLQKFIEKCKELIEEIIQKVLLLEKLGEYDANLEIESLENGEIKGLIESLKGLPTYPTPYNFNVAKDVDNFIKLQKQIDLKNPEYEPYLIKMIANLREVLQEEVLENKLKEITVTILNSCYFISVIEPKKNYLSKNDNESSKARASSRIKQRDPELETQREIIRKACFRSISTAREKMEDFFKRNPEIIGRTIRQDNQIIPSDLEKLDLSGRKYISSASFILNGIKNENQNFSLRETHVSDVVVIKKPANFSENIYCNFYKEQNAKVYLEHPGTKMLKFPGTNDMYFYPVPEADFNSVVFTDESDQYKNSVSGHINDYKRQFIKFSKPKDWKTKIFCYIYDGNQKQQEFPGLNMVFCQEENAYYMGIPNKFITENARIIFSDSNKKRFPSTQENGLLLNTISPELYEIVSKVLHVTKSIYESESIKREKGFKMCPRFVQIFAILRIIDSVLYGEGKGSIGQIKTGEGKSFIIAVSSIVLTMFGKKVDIITSTSDLAVRDHKEQKIYYDLFRIKSGVLLSKQGDKQLLEITSSITEGNHGYTTKVFDFPVIYSTNYNLEFVHLISLFQKKLLRNRPYDVVIVDEVDNMLIDQASTPAVIAREYKIAELQKILKIIFDMRDCSIFQIKGVIASTFPHYSELDEEKLTELKKSALKAANNHRKDYNYFVNEKNKAIVIDEHTGCAKNSHRWSSFIHEFIEIKEKLNVKDPIFSYCAISQDVFFNLYSRITGVSGTLGENFLKNLLRKIYNIKTFSIPANKPIIRKEEVKTRPDGDVFDIFPRIFKEANEELLKGRPVLIIFDSLASLYAFTVFQNSDNQIKGIHPASDEIAVKRAGDEGVLTLATVAAGRGMDIKPTKKSLQNGGLHVIIPKIPRNQRTLDQAVGRAARQGNPGSASIYISPTDKFLETREPEEKYKNLFRIQGSFSDLIRSSWDFMFDEDAAHSEENLFLPLTSDYPEVLNLLAWRIARDVYIKHQYQIQNLLKKAFKDYTDYKHPAEFVKKWALCFEMLNLANEYPMSKKQINAIVIEPSNRQEIAGLIHEMVILSWSNFFVELAEKVRETEVDDWKNCKRFYDEFLSELFKYLPKNVSLDEAYRHILKVTVGSRQNPPRFLFYIESSEVYKKGNNPYDLAKSILEKYGYAEFLNRYLAKLESWKKKGLEVPETSISGSRSNYGYNRFAAIRYAWEWFDKRNNDYYSYGADCANFVSQCLYAGGVRMDGQWHSYKKNETWFTDVRRWNPFAPEQNKCFEWDVTPAWRIANRQYEYFSNTFNGLINGEVLTIENPDMVRTAANEWRLQEGDIMYMAENSDNPHHAMIITKIENNEICFCAHTNSQIDKKLSEVVGNKIIKIIKIRDEISCFRPFDFLNKFSSKEKHNVLEHRFVS